MWMFTVANWYARRTDDRITGKHTDINERIEAVVTRLSFNDSVRLMKQYSDAFKRRYAPNGGPGSVMEYRLLAAIEIPDDADISALSDLSVQELTREHIDHLNRGD